MHFYAKINKLNDIYLVTFPDIKNINTYGSTLDEAIQNASEALNGCIVSDFSRGFKLPERKEYSGKEYYKISLLPHISLALQLRGLRGNKTQIEMARLLGVSYQAYQKLENPSKSNPTIKTIEKVSKSLNKELIFKFV
ncbi:MAG TPA: type II toxin-antitoxin system HicB family antitoxin [Ignavibacteria bacterium]|nr:type II toxin-antitoxin system HicB family antitoxin [Ignavibacteria bacterium]